MKRGVKSGYMARMAAVGETEAGNREEWVQVAAGRKEPSKLEQRWSWGVSRDEEGVLGPEGSERGP